MKIVAISDIHEIWHKLPPIPKCDILISAGDYSYKGRPEIVRSFHKWLNQQDAAHIISVQGNHELWVEKNFEEAKKIALEECPAVHFIDEGLVEIEGLKIWCSAITPWFHNWAWNRYINELIEHWSRIPDDTDILVTHGPPYGILDELPLGGNAGCVALRDRVKEVQPDLHIFGHIHYAHGHKKVDNTDYYNVASCDEDYRASQGITVINYEKENSTLEVVLP